MDLSQKQIEKKAKKAIKQKKWRESLPPFYCDICNCTVLGHIKNRHLESQRHKLLINADVEPIPDQSEIIKQYALKIASNNDEGPEWIKRREKELADNSNKIMCSCFRIVLKERYKRHTLSKTHKIGIMNFSNI